MKYLFICRYNLFRSKIAEAYALKHGLTAKSAGYFPGRVSGQQPAKTIRACAKELDLEFTEETQGLKYDLILWADKIIILDDVDTSEIFNHDDVECWYVSDVPSDASVADRVKVGEEIISQIKAKCL